MKKFSVLATLMALLATLAIAVPGVSAATTCTFATSGSTMTLQADCTTDATILIPNGFTLNGNGHTITGIDPPADHFRGAVVRNGGAVAHVRRLGVTVSGLANVCDDGDDRLRGIMFDGASGSIRDSNVHDINQGASGCQEGNAIEVRSAPFDGTHPATKAVTIRDNIVSDYQKTGIIGNGDVTVKVEKNTVTGIGPVNYIAQNGIQIGFGGLGIVRENSVSGNVYTGSGASSSGILLVTAGIGVRVSDNDVAANDVGIWLNGANSGKVLDNAVSGSTYDGIALDDSFGPVQNGLVRQNDLAGNGVGVGIYGGTATGNQVKGNEAENNGDGFFIGSEATANTLQANSALDNAHDGIWVDADSNTIRRNRALGNGNLDIENTGSGNTYAGNNCDTSSGPPVDCGAPPTTTGTLRTTSAASRPPRAVAAT
jgi:parallel beta-helix repeat protein